MKILAILLLSMSSFVNAQCAQPQQDGTLILTTETVDMCSGLWLTPASDIRNFQTVEVTPASFALAFGFGISSVLTFWFLPYVGSVAGNVIRKM